jgi:hypothetical protein
LSKHAENFIQAIRSNDPSAVHCSIQEGAHVATVAQMGNISYRSGQKLIWDATKGGFSDPKVNQKYLTNIYHNGYSLPTSI